MTMVRKKFVEGLADLEAAVEELKYSGGSSSNIAEIQNDIDNIKSELAEIQSDGGGSLGSRIDALEATVSSLQSTIETITTE